MPFDFRHIQSVSFGVCLDTAEGESYRIIPCEDNVQTALEEMLEETRAALTKQGTTIDEFSPAEKYSANERLRIPMTSDLVAKYRQVFAAENLSTDSNGLNDISTVVSYFAVFRDRNGSKLMGFRRAAQFKGVIKKHLVTLVNDALHMVEDKLFKLDTDFDFLIFDDQILIWRPSGFVFTADIDAQIASSAVANLQQISQEVSCVDFTSLRTFVSQHKLAMRLVAALKNRNDLADISLRHLRSSCRENKVEFAVKSGKIVPTEGSEMGFLLLLDRRLYTLTLINDHPETYQAASRSPAAR